MRPRAHAVRPHDLANRRPGVLPGWRLGVLLAVTATALAGPAAVAGADTTTPIVVATVYGSGGSVTSDSASPANLTSGSQPCPTYSRSSMNEVGRQGPVPVDFPVNATWTVATILGCMQTPIPAAGVSAVTVVNSDGSPELSSGSQLTGSDLATPSDFASSAENPVVADLGSSVEYDRPWRGGTDEDFQDEVVQAPPLSIEVFEGPRLTVTASASRTTVPTGTTVSFSSTVTGSGASGLSYRWNFDGGAANTTRADPEIRFASAGVWDVTLEVRDSAGGGGGTTIPITVTSASAAHASGPHVGPKQSHGTTRGGSAGSPRSQATGTTGSADTTSGGAGSNHDGGTPASSNPAPSTATTGTSVTTTPSPAHQATTPSSHRRPGSVTRPNQGRPPLGTGVSSAPLVTGRLVSDVVALAPRASPLVRSVPAAAVTAPALGPIKRASALPIVAAGLAILVLLGLGAGRELRGSRRWQAR